MHRINSEPRHNHVAIVNSQGLVYTHEDPAGNPLLYRYWREDAHYAFSLSEINVLEEAASAIFNMFVEAGDWLLSSEGASDLERFNIPAYAMRAVIESWTEMPGDTPDQDPTAFGSIYGRFDVRFGGLNHTDATMRVPKLYEFNADTPTSVVESVVQWPWLENTDSGKDQFNSLFTSLMKAWKRNLEVIERKIGFKPVVYFACTSGDPSHEDEMNTAMIMDTCQQAGYQTKSMYTEDFHIGDDGRYYDPNTGDHLDVVFKLFPWEQMTHEETSIDLFRDMNFSGYGDQPYRGGTIWIEPPYKLLWSTKAILPVLWKLFGERPDLAKYLIPSWFADEAPKSVLSSGYAKKPILSREGADITLVLPNGEKVEGEVQGYGDEGYVIQKLELPPVFRRKEEGDKEVYTVIGLWMVDGEVAGMGIRESGGPITDNFSNFLPHVITDGPKTYQSKPPMLVTSASAGNTGKATEWIS